MLGRFDAWAACVRACVAAMGCVAEVGSRTRSPGSRQYDYVTGCGEGARELGTWGKACFGVRAARAASCRWKAVAGRVRAADGCRRRFVVVVVVVRRRRRGAFGVLGAGARRWTGDGIKRDFCGGWFR
jgi:hypothetical protein